MRFPVRKSYPVRFRTGYFFIERNDPGGRRLRNSISAVQVEEKETYYDERVSQTVRRERPEK